MKKNKILIVLAVVGVLCGGAFAGLIDLGEASGYMNVFDNDAGAQGGYLWGSEWGVADLKTVTTDDLTFELFPNINTYVDNPGDAYWRNNAGAGPDGNKWLEATTMREYGAVAAGETSATFDFSVSASDLDSRYSATAFIKTLDPNNGYAVAHNESVDITGAVGTTQLSIGTPGDELVAGHILQVGFTMNGLNANPDTDWGSVTTTMQDFQVVPEPATAGLIVIFGGFLARYRRYIGFTRG